MLSSPLTLRHDGDDNCTVYVTKLLASSALLKAGFRLFSRFITEATVRWLVPSNTSSPVEIFASVRHAPD
jgi:hypothetical protein